MTTHIKTFSGRKADEDAAKWANEQRASGATVSLSLAIDRQNGKHISIMATS